ncbi:hypothetical protein GCM10011581_20790 [Saccharopolyspora subtropica]|uniref:Uncharacterized protein n=1 Tax=Saccharopolyspora thermophila TaxID=89367 RepID=A0A917JVD0_9PSEU|nr:hypothetical protein [Saccharopolyspora subtropica]GGI83394.1 hypothetical protein GCM10011581_20790 [Saccharopolyspora subtropica]
MKPRKVSGCDNGTCAAVYVSDQGTAVVQGNSVAHADGLELGDGESAVELPPDVVLDAVSALVESAHAAAVHRLREVLG